tara:strand:- start:2107 stop:2868 length:762 start_codon:yes stop_codon:yes gene_type:complete
VEIVQKRIIRCDDYPYGDPRHVELFKKIIPDPSQVNNAIRAAAWEVMAIFEKESVDYIWGVSPMLLQPGDVQALNHFVKKGKLVMHGFDHGVSVIPIEQWKNIHDIYHLGGEYAQYKNASQIINDYNIAHSIMQNLKQYDMSLFIPPFNSYNQIFLDAISNSGNVKKLYICQTEYENFLKDLYHWNIQLDLSTEGKSYTNVKLLLKNFNEIWNESNEDHICLHPMYDFIDFGSDAAAEMYQELALKISKQPNQ